MIIDYLGYLAIPLLLGGLFIVIIMNTILSEYDIRKHTISDLGSSDITPYYNVFNILFMILSFLFTFFYFTMHKICLQIYDLVVIINAGFLFLYVSSITMFFIGLFPTNKHPKSHHFFAILIFFCLFMGINFIGFSIMFEGGHYIPMIIITIIFSVFGFLFLVKQYPWLEWVFFVIVIVIGLLFVLGIFD